ncbi:TonB-dependent receptor plug domain-containing protein [Pseudoxanthomonas sp.]|uniref:TonB-dependent receptor plug domain-containing protein n=1 Tax=Pseudoxanthomonas sp. TaxID=1871049 RepID=UPI003F7E4CDB
MPVRNIKRSRLTAAMVAVLLAPTAAFAQDTSPAPAGDTTNLDKVTVTGSLIPQTQLENFTPVTTISAEDIKTRGFTSVADALQQSAFSTGGVQGGQTSASFTQGAETVSMFGLDPGYTKYLIDGRPMANYPALYNGSDTFNNISGIPIDLVERIEILPGGQSSLYGSDAIAGVINIILKKNMDGGALSVRGGAYGDGGGDSFRVSLAKGFTGYDGRLNVLAGIQAETKDPIWGYQRDLTKQYNVNGYTPPLASRDYLVAGYRNYAADGGIKAANNGYFFLDPNNCSTVGGQFGGSEGLQNRPGFGQYCGSFATPGYRTITNGKESAQAYGHATFDVSDSLQFYGDVLYSHEEVKYATGSAYTWWSTSAKYGYFYDPDLDALVNLQRAFSPEDIGGQGYRDIMNTDRSSSYSVTFGANGVLGNWDWDLGLTRTEYRLKQRRFARWADPINNYFEQNVLGPQLGLDPVQGLYPVFRPDYAAFYTPMSPADFASFTGFATSRSKTWDNMIRAQVTNSALFSLPGGDAGLAVVVEGGNQGWDYTPDARLIADPETLESQVWGTTAVSGAGHRTRYAVTSELRLPVLEPLTVTLSGRYDAFDAYGETVDKPTYSIGLEYRPIESLLLRGKYGTAFRAPTLSDTFQGVSGYYDEVTDYYRCAQEGYLPGNTADCAYDDSQFFGQQAGNTKLEPITADVWSAGVVWAPSNNLSMSVDYFAWDIENEVDLQSTDQLSLMEYYCRTGQMDTGSQGCQNALAWITRDGSGAIETVFTPKVNVAKQKLRAVNASVNYLLDIGRFGALKFAGNYTNTLKHTVTPLPGDPAIDLLRDPYSMWVYDAYAKTRADLSVAWNKDKWTTTVYANRIGKTPNWVAYNTRGFTDPRAGWWAPYITYNMSVNYAPMDNLEFSFMVNNLLDKTPEDQARSYPGNEATPYNNALYNVYGRSFFVEARYKFGK